MTQLFSLCFFVLLIFVCQESCTANPYETPSETFDYMMKLSLGLKRIHKAAVATEEKRSWTPKEMKIIQELKALSKNFEEIKSAISTKVSEDLNDRLMQLFDHFQTIQFLYSKFVVMFDNMNTYANSDIKRFANTVTRENLGELHTIAQKMHELLVFEEESIVNAFLEPDLPFDVVCTKTHSTQHLIYDLYRAVVLSHTKQMLMVLFSFNAKSVAEDNTYRKLHKQEVSSYLSRMTRTFDIIKDAMSKASRELKNCDPKTQKIGVTYSKLDPILQGYFVYESDSTRSAWTNLVRSCGKFTNVEVKCHHHTCKNQPKEKVCKGKVHDCQYIDKTMKLCHSPIESKRRYEWMTTSSGEAYGHKVSRCTHTQEVGTAWPYDTCFCKCESPDKKADRYFSLKPVIADEESNKVITGVRLALDNHVYHIQIQQGTLGPNGTITDQPVWKDIETIPESEFFADVVNNPLHKTVSKNNPIEGDITQPKNQVYTVTYNNNIVFLDDLNESDFIIRVLTGIRFEKLDNILILGIRTTPFDYATGFLGINEHLWSFNGASFMDREEVSLVGVGDPLGSEESNTESFNRRYLQFDVTGTKLDLGQSIIPYIDLQEVVTNPPSPLSGAGLYHKRRPNTGGFLALKLIEYDFSRYL